MRVVLHSTGFLPAAIPSVHTVSMPAGKAIICALGVMSNYARILPSVERPDIDKQFSHIWSGHPFD